LFGVPAGELAWIDVHADDVLGRDSERVRERMREAATWPERFAAVDAALRRRLSAPSLPAAAAATVPDVVARAWRLLLESRGAIPISALADEVGWSTRHLAARFRAEIGLTPKAAARVIRFDRARRLITSDSDATLVQVAAQCGYFDQAHLDREFRLLAGCSPSRWLADEGGTVQHVDVDAFRNVQADRAQAA
jgi:transcriptional regulator GlxA family with amidase domain